MGGMDAGVEVEHPEVTKDNLGDLLVLNYAEFLRQYDAFSADMDALYRKATDYETDFNVGLPKSVFDPRLGIPSLSAIEFTDEMKDDAANHLALKALLAAYRSRTYFNAYGNVVQRMIDGEKKRVEWPLNAIVEVEDISSEGGVFRRVGSSQPRHTPPKVQGRLIAWPNYEGGSLVVVRDRKFIPNRMFETQRPIIDKENDYLANVKITFLD